MRNGEGKEEMNVWKIRKKKCKHFLLINGEQSAEHRWEISDKRVSAEISESCPSFHCSKLLSLSSHSSTLLPFCRHRSFLHSSFPFFFHSFFSIRKKLFNEVEQEKFESYILSFLLFKFFILSFFIYLSFFIQCLLNEKKLQRKTLFVYINQEMNVHLSKKSSYFILCFLFFF